MKNREMVKKILRSNWKNVLIFVFVFSALFNYCSANNVLEEKIESSLNIEASMNSSEILIENKGNTVLMNIRIIKDEKEIIQQVARLDIGESESVQIFGISGINLEKEKPTSQNEGWITITYDQGIEKKIVYWYVVRHSPIPNTQEVVVYKIIPSFLVVLSIVIMVFWMRKKLRK